MRTINANGLLLPALGQGGWNLNDTASKRESEMAALRRGIELGMNLIDTAEMYGDGRSEELIGEAIKGIPRGEVLLVSKVLPSNAGRKSIFSSCENSLKRLKTDYLDLYLLHWPGAIPLEETVFCMEELIRQGKIRRYGVSNFDVCDMEALMRVPGGENCAANQVLYHLGSRGIEFDLLPWLEAREMAAMAYCPLAQAGSLTRMNKPLLSDETLNAVAEKYDITVMQLLLAFTLKKANVMAIPKAGSVAHVEKNAAVADVQIAPADWAKIDAVFWPPTAKMHLDIE